MRVSVLVWDHRDLADDTWDWKMAPSDSTKVALGVLALAGIGIAVYLVCKQMRRKKKANGEQSKHGFNAD